jgi:hypothetical protein
MKNLHRLSIFSRMKLLHRAKAFTNQQARIKQKMETGFLK